MLDDIYKDAESRMKKAVEAFKKELAKIRTGRATPALLEGIKVNYYGNLIPLNQIATIMAPEPRLLRVKPFDQGAIGEIDKAIKSSGLGLNPRVEKGVINIPIPPLSEERRKELIKLLHKLTEDARVSVRNIRRDAIEMIREMEKNKEISEDEKRVAEKKIQDLTDKYIEQINEIMEAKEKEIMEE